MTYIIAKQAYGRERFYSIIRQGQSIRHVWVEDEKLAQVFESLADAKAYIYGTQSIIGRCYYFVRESKGV
jgi:hypothetical protein